MVADQAARRPRREDWAGELHGRRAGEVGGHRNAAQLLWRYSASVAGRGGLRGGGGDGEERPKSTAIPARPRDRRDGAQRQKSRPTRRVQAIRRPRYRRSRRAVQRIARVSLESLLGAMIAAGPSGLQPRAGRRAAPAWTSTSRARSPSSRSFSLSQSGTFVKVDFVINKSGIAAVNGTPVPQLGVRLGDLEMLEILGKGAKELGEGAPPAVVDDARGEDPQRLRQGRSATSCCASCARCTRTRRRGSSASTTACTTRARCTSCSSTWTAARSPTCCRSSATREVAGSRSSCSALTRHVLEGLNHLHHERHQVHRDMKPGNILLNSSGEVKISDFGLSAELDSTKEMCATFIGTHAYMSPERLGRAVRLRLGHLVARRHARRVRLGRVSVPSVRARQLLRAALAARQRPGAIVARGAILRRVPRLLRAVPSEGGGAQEAERAAAARPPLRDDVRRRAPRSTSRRPRPAAAVPSC